MTVGERIKARRIELGLSVDLLAEKIGKNRATIYRYESNEIENMSIVILEPLAKALDTTPAYLMGWEENKEEPAEIPPEKDITFDDFTYAMYNETKELSEETKKALLDMARIFKNSLDNKEK